MILNSSKQRTTTYRFQVSIFHYHSTEFLPPLFVQVLPLPLFFFFISPRRFFFIFPIFPLFSFISPPPPIFFPIPPRKKERVIIYSWFQASGLRRKQIGSIVTGYFLPIVKYEGGLCLLSLIFILKAEGLGIFWMLSSSEFHISRTGGKKLFL